MKGKRFLSVLLSLAMACSMAMTTTVSAANVSELDVAPIDRVALYDIEDTLALGTQGKNERHSHGATVTQLPDGDLFAVWFSSNPSGERNATECRIVGARSTDNGKTWTKPFEVYNLYSIPSNNPVIYVDSNERLWVFFCTIFNGQWVSAIPRYIYADAGSYERSEGYTENPDWHYPEPMYMLAGEVDGEGTWDEATQSVVYESGDRSHVRYVSEEVAKNYLDPSEYVKVDAWENPEDMTSDVIDTKYITDSFVVGIRNQVAAAVEYMETEKPYDDEFSKRNDFIIGCVNEGFFLDVGESNEWYNGYKCEPSLKDGAIRRAAGADNNLDLWNPTYRVMGWQTKNPPLEITVPAGETLSDGTIATEDTTRMLLPLYSDSLAISIVVYTDDSGETWAYSNPIAGLGNIQGTIIQKEDGTLYQYFRTGKLDGKNDRLDWKTPRIESHDYGVTWENHYVEPYLRNDGGFAVLKLDDGTWVMVTNQDLGTDLRTGSRASVSLNYSFDEGETWESIMLDAGRMNTNIIGNDYRTGEDDGTGKFGKVQYQYPGIIQLNDGSLLTIYTWTNVGVDKIMRSAQVEDLYALLDFELKLNKTTSVLKPGETEQLTVETLYKGNPYDGDELLFRTTTPDVVTVSLDGLVTAQSEGLAKILVSSTKYGAIAECLYTVSNKDYPAAPAVPELESKTTSSITVKAVDGLEYRLDDGAWQTSNTFTGLKSGTSYSITARVAETETALASAPSEALVVRTSSSSGGSSGGASGAVDNYTLSFNSNGGSKITAVTKKSGSTISLTGYVPTKDGYDFAGWYTDSALTKAVTSVKLSADMTVYAKWTAKTADSAQFADVASNAYYAQAVKWAVEQGITSGVGANLFAPDMECTRAQIVTFLWNAAGSPEPSSKTNPFVDVKTSDYFYKAVLWAVENGVTAGTSATTFGPDAVCTRAQAMTFLYNANGKPAAAGSAGFSDVADNAYYAAPVAWAVKNNVTSGIGDGLFGSDNICTRAQIVTFLYKLDQIQ